MATEKKLQKSPKFVCEKCEFTSSKQNEYERHIDTNKHKRLHGLQEKNSDIVESKTFNCICGKKYNHHTSLAKHKRTCSSLHESTVSDNMNCQEVHTNISNQNIKI